MATNSYMNAQQPASGLTSYSAQQLGGLQPLVSDLMTPSKMANSYMAQTYDIDPTKMSERLGQYQFYDPKQLGGLASYFAPQAATTYKSNLVFKPEDFQAAQAKLGGIPTDQLANLQGILGNYKSVGDMGGTTYFKKPELESALSGYSVIPEANWNDWSKYPDAAGLNPVADLGDQLLFGKDDAAKIVRAKGLNDFLTNVINPSRYTVETKEAPATTDWWGNPIQPTQQLEGWTLNPAQTNPFTGEIEKPAYYSRQVAGNPITNWDQFIAEYGQTPAGGWSDSNTKYAYGGGLGGLMSNIMGQLGGGNPMQSWLNDPSKAMNFSLYGTGSPEDIQRGFNTLQRAAPQNIGEFWIMPPEVQKGILENPGIALQQMKATANPANHDWLSIGAEGGLRDISNWEWNKQTGLTPTPGSYLDIHDGKSWTKPLSLVGSVLSFTPLAPLGMAMNAVSAIANKNPLGAIASFLPATGIGNALGGALNSGLGMGLGQVGANAIGAGLLGAGMGALSGGGLKGALLGGAMGGLGSYASGTLGNYLQGSSPLAQIAGSIGLNTGLGALSSALRGRDIGQGALSGLASGAFKGVSNPAVRNMLLKELYS